MTNYTICLDGIDKTGKDTILGFIDQLSNHKYIVNVRGIISQYAYNDIYERPKIYYDLKPQEHIVNVLLDVDYEDWCIRCALTNEPKIDYYKHRAVFQHVAAELELNNCKIIRFNTSIMTPYQIAIDIIKYIKTLD